MIIITKNNKYFWDYKVLAKNLLAISIAMFFIVSYLVLAKMDFNVMVGKWYGNTKI